MDAYVYRIHRCLSTGMQFERLHLPGLPWAEAQGCDGCRCEVLRDRACNLVSAIPPRRVETKEAL